MPETKPAEGTPVSTDPRYTYEDIVKPAVITDEMLGNLARGIFAPDTGIWATINMGIKLAFAVFYFFCRDKLIQGEMLRKKQVYERDQVPANQNEVDGDDLGSEDRKP